MRRAWIEAAVGLLLTLMAVACLGLVAARAAGRLGPGAGYDLTADFASVGGLQPRAAVEIAGVPAGSVESISLRHDAAHVVLHVDASVLVPADSNATIKSEGLVGETYVAIQPGTSGAHLAPGGRIQRTVSAINLEDAIAAHIFGRVS
jgi:phospholipid/cholesterol/gamma-HCH transport system substrate-binding protein